MAARQLSVRSDRACDLAHNLSRAENRPIHAIVEDALVAYAARSSRNVSFQDFWAKLETHRWNPEPGEPDLMDLIDENRVPHKGLEF
jgi:hypothetical protein